MIAEGATSFWEAYDPAGTRTTSTPRSQSDNRSGYFV